MISIKSGNDSSMTPWILYLFVLVGAFLIGYFLSVMFARKVEGFEDNILAYRNDPNYKTQLKAIVDRFDPISSKRRDITAMLQSASDMPDYEQCFVNFQTLACNFTGYLGPFQNGFFDADNATLYALKAGCRTFILEIDYIDSCSSKGEAFEYYPKLIIRDVQGKIVTLAESTLPFCNSDVSSNIRQVCSVLRNNAFGSVVQNANDPLVIVLYLLRLPPPDKTGNQTLLSYYSRIARGLEPLLDKTLDSSISGGTFARQQQESVLLTNSITSYEGRVLIFCNSDTSPFRKATGIPQSEDLDYLVNLRLSYKQTQLGCTSNQTGGSFGGIETVQSFLTIPPSQVDNTCDDTKLRWTVCLPQDPSQPVSDTNYNTLANTFGVHCIPIQLWDTSNTFMFSDNTFATYSFMPKPKNLRFIKPPTAVPAQASPATNANGGMLRTPTLG